MSNEILGNYTKTEDQLMTAAFGSRPKRIVKEDEEKLKKRKLRPEPTTVAPKKRKAAALKQKATDIEEETPASPSTTDVVEILKVITESLPIKLSPLAPHLTKLFQKKEPSIAKKAAGPKKMKNYYCDRSYRRDTTTSFGFKSTSC
jgi:hypothetical protein